jgi:hypothetical protein
MGKLLMFSSMHIFIEITNSKFFLSANVDK